MTTPQTISDFVASVPVLESNHLLSDTDICKKAPRRSGPPHKLLLLQPSTPDGEINDGPDLELEADKRWPRKASTSLKGPLGPYEPRPQRVDSVPRRRTFSKSSTLQSPLPGSEITAGSTSSHIYPSSSACFHLDYQDLQQSSPEASPFLMKSQAWGGPQHSALINTWRATSAASYMFPLPPQGAVGSAKDEDFAGLGLDLDFNYDDFLQRRDSSDGGPTTSESKVESCNSDGLTGSQSWSPDTTAHDAGSTFGLPQDQVTLSHIDDVPPLSIRKNFLLPLADRETAQKTATNDNDDTKIDLLRSSPILPGLPHEALGGLVSPWSGDADVLSESVHESDHHSVTTASSLGPFSGLRAEVGESWRETHWAPSADTQADDTDLDAQFQGIILSHHSLERACSMKTSPDQVDALYQRHSVQGLTTPTTCSSVAFHSPILSGLLASVATALPTQGLGTRAASPELASLRAEFGSYVSLIETSDSAAFGPPSMSRATEIAPCDVFSPPLSDAELGGVHTPEPLEEFPSPCVNGSSPFNAVLTDSRTSATASIAMLSARTEKDLQRIHAALDKAPSDDQPTPASDSSAHILTSSVLSRGRPIPASTSASSFLGGQRELGARLARGRDPVPLRERCPNEASRQAPCIPKRSNSMSRVRAAKNLEESTATRSVYSQAASIQRVWREQNRSVEFAEQVKDLSLPKVLVTAHPSALSNAAAGQRTCGIMFMGDADRPIDKFDSEFIGRGRSAFDYDDAGRPLTLSQEARAALAQEICKNKPSKFASTPSLFSHFRAVSSEKRKKQAAVRTSRSGSKTASPQHAARSNQATLLFETDDAPIANDAREVKVIDTDHRGSNSSIARPRVVSSTKRGMPYSVGTGVSAASTDQSARQASRRKIFVAQAPMVAPCSMPTLFVARTPSQRRRGDTGIPETQPRVIAAAKQAAASGVRKGVLKNSAQSVGKARWSQVQALRKPQHDISNGLVLVVEETQQDVAHL